MQTTLLTELTLNVVNCMQQNPEAEPDHQVGKPANVLVHWLATQKPWLIAELRNGLETKLQY